MYKKYFIGKKGAIFDLDNTIVDTHEMWLNSLGNALKSFGVSDVDFKIYFEPGADLNKSVEIIVKSEKLSGIDPKLLAEKTRAEYINELDKITQLYPKPGFWELTGELKQKKQFKLALTTNTETSIAQKLLSKLEINLTFDIKLFGDNVKNKKPNPEIYKKALKLLNLSPKEAVVFEDSVTGVKSSMGAGIDTIVIWNGETPKYEYPAKAALFVPDFSAFPGNMDRTYEEAYFEEIDLITERAKERAKPKRPH